ncbi:MAG TPA: lipase secretion chaperone [Pseudoxanthomonas sp.]
MPGRSRPILGAGAVVLALLVLAGWRAFGDGRLTGDISPASAGQNESSAVGRGASPIQANSDIPASLQGTQPDGAVRFDGNGEPIADAELRRRFDWYLAALGEQDLQTIRSRLARDSALLMNPVQVAAVLAWFDRHVAYQRASTHLAEIDDLQARLQAVGALRKQMLGEAAARGFFGEEENEALRVIALKQAQADPGLDPAQREALQRELEARSPGYAEARRESELRQQLHQMDAALDRQDVSAAERHAERSALIGAEAADRFAELDRVRADWNARVHRYARQRAALQARNDLSGAQRQEETRRLLAAFTPAEQRRIAALQGTGALR